MLGHSSFSRGSMTTSNNRLFVYEVSGLQQNAETDRCEHQIRTSSNTFMQVPLDRMNETMQRIVRLGGKIVNIHPLNAVSPQAASNHEGESQHQKGKK
jgi:phycocyanin-associated, rod